MWPFSSTHEDAANPGWRGKELSPAQLEQSRKQWEEKHTQPSKPIMTAEPDAALKDYVRQPQRLGLNPVGRLALLSTVSFVTGLALGSANGSRIAAMRYRAENAHYMPISKAGWYLYGRSRNYHAIIGGVTEGVKTGARFAGWAALFVVIEEGLDRARGTVFRRRGEEEGKGQRDFLNTVSAAVALSGLHGWWNNLDRFAAMRMTRFAVRYAVPYGLMQDFLAAMRGDRPWYIDSVLKRTLDRTKTEVPV